MTISLANRHRHQRPRPRPGRLGAPDAAARRAPPRGSPRRPHHPAQGSTARALVRPLAERFMTAAPRPGGRAALPGAEHGRPRLPSTWSPRWPTSTRQLEDACAAGRRDVPLDALRRRSQAVTTSVVAVGQRAEVAGTCWTATSTTKSSRCCPASLATVAADVRSCARSRGGAAHAPPQRGRDDRALAPVA